MVSSEGAISRISDPKTETVNGVILPNPPKKASPSAGVTVPVRKEHRHYVLALPMHSVVDHPSVDGAGDRVRVVHRERSVKIAGVLRIQLRFPTSLMKSNTNSYRSKEDLHPRLAEMAQNRMTTTPFATTPQHHVPCDLSRRIFSA